MVKILDIVERLMKMDRLIKEKRTGSAKQLAEYLGISRSHLFNHLEEFRDLGIDIRYDKSNYTYEYYGNLEPEIREPLLVIRKKNDLSDTNGGTFCKSPSFLDSMRLILIQERQ